MEQNVSTEKKSSEVIVVTSGKGGVGKTTTSANVGTGLAKAGCKVCLIDGMVYAIAHFSATT